MASRISCHCFSLHALLFLFICWCSLSAHGSTEADTISWGQSLFGDLSLVSKGGTFELGFFPPGNNSHNYYIGIWYKKRPERTVVWVANRDKPMSNPWSSELKITHDGNLAILNQSKTQIWSSNVTSKASNSTIALLLDTGNLVLINGSNPSMLYWQSFDHPTDTWLPGARIGWNKHTKQYMTLTSWRSLEDPSLASYSYGMDPKGSDQLVQLWNGTEIYWTSGEWNGQYFNSVPEMTTTKLYNYTYFETENYITYSQSDTQIITRFVADISGQGMQWEWRNNSRDWLLTWTQPTLLLETDSTLLVVVLVVC